MENNIDDVASERYSQKIDAYRDFLTTSEQRTQDSFDKTVVTLSSGALGISFAFIKDIVGDMGALNFKWLLFSAWIAWGVSVTAVLVSYFFGRLSFQRAIKQVDDGVIQQESPGGSYSRIANGLNIISGLSFIVGLIILIVFVAHNL